MFRGHIIIFKSYNYEERILLQKKLKNTKNGLMNAFVKLKIHYQIVNKRFIDDVVNIYQ